MIYFLAIALIITIAVCLRVGWKYANLNWDIHAGRPVQVDGSWYLAKEVTPTLCDKCGRAREHIGSCTEIVDYRKGGGRGHSKQCSYL